MKHGWVVGVLFWVLITPPEGPAPIEQWAKTSGFASREECEQFAISRGETLSIMQSQCRPHDEVPGWAESGASGPLGSP